MHRNGHTVTKFTPLDAAAYALESDRVAHRYWDRALDFLKALRDACEALGLEVTGPHSEDYDEQTWSLEVAPQFDHSLVDVEFRVLESVQRDGTYEGLSFGLTIVEFGGALVGEWLPGNGSDFLWIDPRDQARLEERFRAATRMDFPSTARLIAEAIARMGEAR